MKKLLPFFSFIFLCAFSPVESPAVSSVDHIKEVLPTVLFELDATQIDSTDGSSQVWSTLNLDPPDGLVNTKYNFSNGATTSPSTDDMTFTGTAGSCDAYWAHDSNDRSRVNPFFSNPEKLNIVHKTDNTDGEIGYHMRFYSVTAWDSTDVVLFGTTNANSDHGARFEFDGTNNRFEIRQTNGSAASVTNVGSSITLGTGWHTVSIAIQKTSGTGGNFRFKLDDEDVIEGSLTAFGTTTTDSSDQFQISGVAGSNEFPNESRLAAFVVDDGYTSTKKMELIKNYWDQRLCH